MPKPLNPKETFDYVLKADRDLPDGHPYKTVFYLRPLTIDEEERVGNQLFGGQMGSTNLELRSGSHARSILDAGLQGWSNFNTVADDSNEDWTTWVKTPVTFERTRATNGKVKTELLDMIESGDRTELSNAVTGRGKVGDEEGNV